MYMGLAVVGMCDDGMMMDRCVDDDIGCGCWVGWSDVMMCE